MDGDRDRDELQASSVNPDGVRAQEIKESLAEDVPEELGHAQRFANRIKEPYGVVPGSLEFAAQQRSLQPPAEQTDVVHVIRGVIEAETAAIEHYNRIIEETDELDWVTQDIVIEILHDEEAHPRPFESFLREYEAEGPGLSSRRTRTEPGPLPIKGGGDEVEPLAAERRRARRRPPPTRRVLPPVRPMDGAVLLGAVARAIGATLRRAGRRR